MSSTLRIESSISADSQVESTILIERDKINNFSWSDKIAGNKSSNLFKIKLREFILQKKMNSIMSQNPLEKK